MSGSNGVLSSPIIRCGIFAELVSFVAANFRGMAELDKNESFENEGERVLESDVFKALKTGHLAR